MKVLLRVLAVVASLPLLGLGFAAMFAPDAMLDLFDITPRGIYGYNTIRADLGGLLIGSGLMIWIGLWKKQSSWFNAAMFMMALLLVGRLISTVADGWSNAAIPAIAVEIFAIVVLTWYKRLEEK